MIEIEEKIVKVKHYTCDMCGSEVSESFQKCEICGKDECYKFTTVGYFCENCYSLIEDEVDVMEALQYIYFRQDEMLHAELRLHVASLREKYDV